MQRFTTLKLIVLNALLVGALFGLPLPAHAGGDLNKAEIGGLVAASDSDSEVDDIADEGSGGDDDAAGSVGQPEYKYVPVRR